MPNLLTTEAGLKLGPIVLETFFKHYLERKSETSDPDGSGRSTNLRHDDLLWQESFEIVKSFLNRATRHTVEELQEFSNARIPTPPWIWVDRVLVPMTCCDAAATHLIKALGGEAFTKRVVGGTKWWQVRGMRGVDCQWICQKSHLQEARKRKRERGNDANGNGVMRSPSSPRFPAIRKRSSNWGSSRPSKQDGAQQGLDEQNEEENGNGNEDSQDNLADMDGTRCMLYAHGGGYYFGSVDQERYCMQRYARKINGRVFAVNYRLAPQYPFPCAIQDMLAAYLYLIDPPPGAKHAPIPPESIVLSGDSAGGGLCLAALQVMRDSGIPLPAAAVLVSPWSDLTHSFPSTIHNTATDIIPPYGLCLHKPSVLWPPPPEEIASKVRDGIRARFQKVAKRAVHVEALFSQGSHPRPPQPGANAGDGVVARVETNTGGKELNPANDHPEEILENGIARPARQDISDPHLKDTFDTSASAKNPAEEGSALEQEAHEPDPPPVAGKPPLPWEPSETFQLTVDGKPVTIDSQIQLYCPNSLLMHPLISPALGYLGGLPPLLVIASDKEVLRDEIIYLAHKAAHPDRFGINEDSKTIYPPLQNIEGKYQPTPVHLQVYDETAHVLPLFSFTTPAKYCYRAIALFTKRFTSPPKLVDPLAPFAAQTPTPESEETIPEDVPLPSSPNPSASASASASDPEQKSNHSEPRRVSTILRSHSALFKRRSKLAAKTRQPSGDAQRAASDISREDSGDIAGNRFKTSETEPRGPGTAGDPSVYAGLKEWPLGDIMVRERVSTHGILRPLEPESEIPALQLEPGHVGMINEAAARRYLEGSSIWAKKFAKTAKKIETRRKKNLELARGETNRTVKTMAQLQEHLFHEQDDLETNGGYHRKESTFSLHRKQKDKLRERSGDAERHTWGWAWALDDERPPPSSIVSRRDTVEARNLARVADLSVEQEESKMSGNMLWTVLVNFLTTHPRKGNERDEEDEDGGGEAKTQSEGEDKHLKTKGSRMFRRIKSFGGKKREASPAGR